MVPCLQIYLLICVAQGVKNFPAMQETWVRSLGQEDPLEKGKAAHSIILAWEIPWTQEPGRLQSMGSQRVRHDGATFTFPLKENYWIWDILKNYLMLTRSSKKESCWFLHIEMFYFWMFFCGKEGVPCTRRAGLSSWPRVSHEFIYPLLENEAFQMAQW